MRAAAVEETGDHPGDVNASACWTLDRFYMSVDDEIKGLKHDMRCHSLARSQAQEFNRRLRRFQNRDGGFHALAMSSEGLEVRCSREP